MGTVSDSKKYHRVAAVGIFLILAALIVAVGACEGIHTYQLTISSSSGGSVTTPGEGAYTYDTGAVVQLVATPGDGYEFRSWSGDVTYVANHNATSTTITMNGDYAILANFETKGETGPTEGEPVPP